MGIKIFGTDIAKEVGDATRGQLPKHDLYKVTPGTRDSANPTAGTRPTRRRFQFEGIVESYSDRQVDGTLIKRGDRRILVIAATLPSNIVPSQNDEIVAEGTRYTIISVSRDPAAATYTCQARAQ